MNTVLRNILIVIVGWLGGSVVNMGLISLGSELIPIPGIEPNDMAAMAEIMPTLDAKFYIFPFLAHALGTLVGAFIAGIISKTHKVRTALIVGILFLIGGIIINSILKGPLWFTVIDIAFAYIPMAWIGGKIAERMSRK